MHTDIRTSIKVVTGNEVYDYSKLPLDKANNRQLAASIATYYANVAGVGNAVIGVKDHSKTDSKRMLAFTTGKNEIDINSKGGISPLLNDYNNLISAFVHEKDHKDKGHGLREINSFEHSQVYF